MKTVLFVDFHHSPVSMRMLDGVFRYAHEAKWNVESLLWHSVLPGTSVAR